MTSKTPTAREALGFPVIPPSWVIRLMLRFRALLGGWHMRMIPSFNFVLERVWGLVDTKALYCAVDLRLPELLAGGPQTAAQLAATSGADPDALERLLRFLVMRGFFRRRRGRYANNAASDVLRADHPYSFRDWVLFFGSDWNSRIWNELPERVRHGTGATQAAFGVPFFTYLNANEAEGRAFTGAMAAGSRLQVLLFADAIDLSGVKHVCDVGGGSGSAIAHLLRLHLDLRGTVLDLPELEPAAQAVFEAAHIADRASFAGGDFFEAVPAGCDLYVLFAIVHDWDEERCALILSNVRRAMAPGGRIMVVEGVVPAHDGEHVLKTTDMLMLVHAEGGRERTGAEFDALWKRSGLRVSRRTTLPSTFEVFELVPLG